MKNTIFDYQDYKRYLGDLIQSQPKRGRGVRSNLAKAVGCQIAYISQIMNGPIDLNLEQAGRLNRFFGHSKEESHFFMLLVQLARAGDRETRHYFQEQMDAAQARRLVIKNRLGLAQTLTAEDQVTYYSAWYYAAVHILVTVPAFRTKQAIAQKLGLDLAKTNEVLDFLMRTGLVQQAGDQFASGRSLIHLGNDSKLIARHHANWRLRALHSLDRETEGDVHFSAVVSLSKADVTKLKSMVVKKIEEMIAVVKESKEEELAALCVDFFGI